MAKGKLEKFAEMETFSNVFQYPFAVISQTDFPLCGRWHEDYFHNENPIVLELGCGKGEYTVELARMYPDRNFIGVDIKGARMWTGAKAALAEGLGNVAFLRTNIEMIDRFFAAGEVSEIWLTFSDPQMKNPRKRLTSTYFLNRYRQILADGGIINLKTDSDFLFTYTQLTVEKNRLPLLFSTTDLYHINDNDNENENDNVNVNVNDNANGLDDATQQILGIKTHYEKMWIERGLNIKYLKFRLPQEGNLEECDVEIPLDSYRSYHRDKRSSKDKAR